MNPYESPDAEQESDLDLPLVWYVPAIIATGWLLAGFMCLLVFGIWILDIVSKVFTEG